MEILNVTYKCKKGMREKFLETIKAEGLDAASRRILASAVDRTVAAGSSAVMLATVRREELPRGLTHVLELDAEGRVVRRFEPTESMKHVDEAVAQLV